MRVIVKNPIAAALRSGNLPRMAVVGARKGKGSYQRKPKHRKDAWA
jgi:stalled ribosome alternative rescue factor ArfA